MNKSQAVSDMIRNLEEYAKSVGVSLKGNIPADVNKLDDLFGDGGEGRCVHFTDWAFEYAGQFGMIGDWRNDNGFEAHKWTCIESAMKRLAEKWGLKDYTPQPYNVLECDPIPNSEQF